MIVLKTGVLVEPSIVDKSLSEAKSLYSNLSKVLNKEDINIVVGNMVSENLELALALGSLNEDIPINEYLMKHVTSDGDVSKRQDKKSRAREAAAHSKVSLAKRREIARKAARTRLANPAKAREAEQKRQEARKKRTDMGVKNGE